MDNIAQTWSPTNSQDDCPKYKDFIQMYQQGVGDLSEESFSLIRCDNNDYGSIFSSPEFCTEYHFESSTQVQKAISTPPALDGAAYSGLDIAPSTLTPQPQSLLVHHESGASFVSDVNVETSNQLTLDGTSYGVSTLTSHFLPVNTSAEFIVSSHHGRTRKEIVRSKAKTTSSSSSKKKRLSAARKDKHYEKENVPALDFSMDESLDSDRSSFEDRRPGSSSLKTDVDCSKFVKPPYSYSALVTLALKNSRSGRMTVRDIYNFMCHHFPHFRVAPAGWKNSVRHNLSLNPAFLKIVGDSGPAKARTACRWTVNPAKFNKMDDDIRKHGAKSGEHIRRSMRFPELFEQLECGTFRDFQKAVQGVTVQYKKPRDNRSDAKSKSSTVRKKLLASNDSKQTEDSCSYYGSQTYSPSIASSFGYSAGSPLDPFQHQEPTSPFEVLDAGPYPWPGSQYSPGYNQYPSHYGSQ